MMVIKMLLFLHMTGKEPKGESKYSNDDETTKKSKDEKKDTQEILIMMVIKTSLFLHMTGQEREEI